MCYATIALVTDYDCWREEEDNLSIEMIIDNLTQNTEKVKEVIRTVIPDIATMDRTCPCGNALNNAILTPQEMIPDKVKKDLKIIIGKYLKE
jgi:5'-methylthioadenosine phosphorylase